MSVGKITAGAEIPYRLKKKTAENSLTPKSLRKLKAGMTVLRKNTPDIPAINIEVLKPISILFNKIKSCKTKTT